MALWNVYVPRLEAGRIVPIHLGTVEEETETLARCAALSRFGMSEDEYFEAREQGQAHPLGISPGDDFWVSPA